MVSSLAYDCDFFLLNAIGNFMNTFRSFLVLQS